MATEEAVTATADEPAGDTVESWTQDLERQAAVGTPREGQPPPPAEEADPAAAGAPNQPEKPKRPSAALAHEKWRERQTRRTQQVENTELATLRQQHQDLLEVVREALGGELPDGLGGAPQQRQAAAPQREQKQDPEPDYYADPKTWHEWNRRETQRALDAKIDPLVARQQAEERIAAQRTEVQQRADLVANELRQAESDYMQTDEGEGFDQRVAVYPDVAAFTYHAVLGVPQEVAKQMVARQLQESVVIAHKLGQNPAAFLDAMMHTHELIAAQMRAARESGGNGGEQPAALAPAQGRRPTPAAAAARQQLEGMRNAAKAPEAHSIAEQNSTSPASGDDLASLARSGRINPRALAAGLARRGYRGGSSMVGGIWDFLQESDGG